MGVGKSVHQVYKEALLWFDAYVDKESYHAAFDSLYLGLSPESGITYSVFRDWISSNARTHPNSVWTLLLDAGPTIMISHKIATAQFSTMPSDSNNAKNIQFSKFRNLLVHLYVCTILWKHFTFAYKTVPNLHTRKLDSDEFEWACYSLSKLHCKEEVLKIQIIADYSSIDVNNTQSISFVQVCKSLMSYIILFVNVVYANRSVCNVQN